MSELWIPRTVEQLEHAVTSCSISESAYLDLKRFPAQTDGGRRSIAKDLAALSIEGGVIILGVAEVKKLGDHKGAEPFELAPGPLAGWREWASVVALSAVQPSVRVTTIELECEPGVGYLVIVVPVSARAPHMVHGRYYGRSDTTNFQMTDAQARTLWLRNLERRDIGLTSLRREVARDPVPFESRTCARLFVVAQPVSADDRLLLDSVPDRDLRRWASALGTLALFNSNTVSYSPSFGSAYDVSRRARGIARSQGMESDRTVRVGVTEDRMSEKIKNLIDLEIHEDGGLRLYYGRASDLLEARGNVIMMEAVGGEVSGCIELARHIAGVTGFGGAWAFGVALDGLRSAPAYSRDPYRELQWPYSENTYEQVHEADYIELHEPGSPVLEQLLGRFCRSLSETQTTSALDRFPITKQW